jgi:hypothetical protein
MSDLYYYLGYPLDYPGDPLAWLSPESLVILNALIAELKVLDEALTSVVLDSVATVAGKLELDPIRAESMMRTKARGIVKRLSLLTSTKINSDIYGSESQSVQWRVPG